MSNKFVVVEFKDKKKTIADVSIDAVMVNDPEDVVEVEKQYQIQWQKNMCSGIVKFIGSQKRCLEVVSNLIQYKTIETPEKIRKKKVKPTTYVAEVSGKKADLIAKSNERNPNACCCPQPSHEDCIRKIKDRDDLIQKQKEKLADSEKLVRETVRKYEVIQEMWGIEFLN